MQALARLWRPLLSTSLIAFIPAGVISLMAFTATDANEFLDLVLTDPESLNTLPAEVILEMATPLFQAAAIAFGAQLLASLFVYLATHRAVALDASGQAASGAEIRRWALRRYPVGLVAGALSTAAVFSIMFVATLGLAIPSVFLATLVFLAFLGPALWLGGAMSMWSAVLSVEGRGPLSSLTRSIDLVRGRWWPTVGFLLLVGLLGSVAVQLIQLVALPLSFVGDLGVGISLVAIVGLAAQGVIVAGIAAMSTAWYIDLRARREGVVSDLAS